MGEPVRDPRLGFIGEPALELTLEETALARLPGDGLLKDGGGVKEAGNGDGQRGASQGAIFSRWGTHGGLPSLIEVAASS